MPSYRLSKDAVFEMFDDGALVLLLRDRHLVELNPSAASIIRLQDGQRTPEQVAAEIFKDNDISHDCPITNVIQDVLELCKELNQTGVLEPQSDDLENDNMTTSVATYFLRNPDVVLREEDPDEGALLFNPDTNQVKVINTTGLFIWQQCGQGRTLDEIISEVKKGFDEVPLEQAAQDVQEFIDSMSVTGFIGTVERSG